MFCKILVFAAILGCALSVPHATSYAYVTQSHANDHDDYHYQNYASYHADYGYHNGLALGHDVDGSYNGYYNNNHHDEYDHSDHHDYYHHPQFYFKYGVEDPHTHDIKSQEEHRDGDVVKGHYKLVQPDGRIRIVHYTADKHNGFNADVQYSGHAEHPTYYKYY